MGNLFGVVIISRGLSRRISSKTPDSSIVVFVDPTFYPLGECPNNTPYFFHEGNNLFFSMTSQMNHLGMLESFSIAFS